MMTILLAASLLALTLFAWTARPAQKARATAPIRYGRPPQGRKDR